LIFFRFFQISWSFGLSVCLDFCFVFDFLILGFRGFLEFCDEVRVLCWLDFWFVFELFAFERLGFSFFLDVWDLLYL
jgi:hypothetical protein